jgi:phosphatidylinositol alpha-1,6-mannosyltransferase
VITERRARLLLVTRNFPPLTGGMERLNRAMLAGLGNSGELRLVGPEGCASFVPDGVIAFEAPAKQPFWFLLSALWSSLVVAVRYRPRVILAGSGLTAPVAWLAGQTCNARIAVYLHGLDLVVQSTIYQSLWIPMIRRAHVVLVNSENTRRLALTKGVEASRIRVIYPGTTMPDLSPDARDSFRSEHRLEGVPLLLSVGRLTPRKGLAEFVRDVFPRVLAAAPSSVLMIIGHDAKDALTRSVGAPSEVSRVLELAGELGIAQSVKILPRCDDLELSRAFAAADVHVFPVREIAGDIEGFGMVAIEAAAHGVPTVAYRVGGVSEAVSDGVSGALITPGDETGFADAVLRFLSDGFDRDSARAHANRFSWEEFHQRIERALFK